MKEYRNRTNVILILAFISLLGFFFYLFSGEYRLSIVLIIMFAILFIGGVMEYLTGLDKIYGLDDKGKKFLNILGVILVSLFALLLIIGYY